MIRALFTAAIINIQGIDRTCRPVFEDVPTGNAQGLVTREDVHFQRNCHDPGLRHVLVLSKSLLHCGHVALPVFRLGIVHQHTSLVIDEPAAGQRRGQEDNHQQERAVIADRLGKIPAGFDGCLLSSGIEQQCQYNQESREAEPIQTVKWPLEEGATITVHVGIRHGISGAVEIQQRTTQFEYAQNDRHNDHRHQGEKESEVFIGGIDLQ